MDLDIPKNICKEIINVDTGNRDMSKWPNPNECVVPIPIFSNVIRVRVVASQFPHSQYTVNSHNYQFVATSSASPTLTAQTISLTQGTYTADELAIEIQTQLNSASFLNAVATSVTFDSNTRKFSITRTDGLGTLTMLFGSNPLPTTSARSLMGYIEEDVGPATDVSPPQVARIGGDDYCLLYIDGLNNSHSGGARYFAKFQLNVAPHYFAMNTFVCNPMIFPRSATLSHLKLRFESQNGFLYEFNNIDASFDIELTYIDYA